MIFNHSHWPDNLIEMAEDVVPNLRAFWLLKASLIYIWNVVWSTVHAIVFVTHHKWCISFVYLNHWPFFSVLEISSYIWFSGKNKLIIRWLSILFLFICKKTDILNCFPLLLLGIKLCLYVQVWVNWNHSCFDITLISHRWLRARLQHLHCISNEDIADLL